MPRSPALLLAAALLIAVGWGLYSGLVDTPWSEPSESRGGPGRHETAGAGSQQGASGTVPISGERTVLAEPSSRQTRRPGAEEPSKAVKDAVTVAIQVVVAETNKAVPYAEVAAMHRMFDWMGMSDTARDVVSRFGGDNLRLFAHFGNKYTADKEGKVKLPINRVLAVACSHDGRYGELILDAETLETGDVHRLLLYPDQNVRVRVIDGEGTPLGDMPLWLHVSWAEDGEVKRQVQGWNTWAHATTNGKGEATLRHIQERLRQHHEKGKPECVVVGLGIVGLFEDAPSFEFDPLTPPTDVVELVAPPTGSVTVRVLDTENAPIGECDDIGVRLQAAPERTRWSGRPAGDGSASYRYVALGKAFVAEASVNLDVEPRKFLGPSLPGQEVQVELRAELKGLYLVGRLLGTDQKPIGRSHVRLVYEAEQDNGGTWLFATQQDGRFKVEFDDELAGLRLTRCVLQRFARFENTPLLAEVQHPVPLRAGRNDLGNIILGKAPVLVTGSVLIDDKPPSERVELTVDWRDGEAWRSLKTAAVEFPKPERFEIRGLARPGRHRLVPGSRGCLPSDPVEFHPGQRDLTVRLRRGGSVRAEIQLDDPSWISEVVFTLSPQNPTPERERALTWGRRSPGGMLDRQPGASGLSLVWRGLEPGAYRLRLHVAGAPRPLVDLRNLQVPPAAACSDTRLCPVDLRGKLRMLTISVRDESGDPWNNRHAAAWSTTGDAAGVTVASTTMRDDRLSMLVAGPVDLRVAAKGYEPAVLEGVTADTTVRLRRLRTVSLRLPAVKPPPGMKLYLVLKARELPIDKVSGRKGSLAFHASYLTRPSRQTLALGNARTVTVPVRQHGACDVQVMLDHRGKWIEVEGVQPTTIRLDSDLGGERSLEVSQGAIEAAAKKARGR